ncbi:hypothetical protein MASS_1p0029 (plasmid) [Mycobacteroides abscessus subsp. bolletii 50594]|uniref:Uncharacterized protein n=1 Tax=Mycobacteroides abscessus subsp. bolletii 50594 TaxID=1303024 RepID=A0AB33AIE0_9MYCO|nr:hypothetical protein [Mycobacteroides abscessus]AGM31589.1 hypothetical protein MASS_1p0029 [Mycobacteroides abscessus subsp. bolletii 50594]
MTVPWSLTTTDHRTVDTTIGVARDLDAAVMAALAAAYDAIEAAGASQARTARYELRAESGLVAIIQTGVDEDGRPDHTATADLIRRIATQQAVSPVPE